MLKTVDAPSARAVEIEDIVDVEGNIQINNTTTRIKAFNISYEKKLGYNFIKRIIDILLSATALIVLSPVFLVTIIAICIDDFGNPFFAQKRVGKNGKVFKMYKFRSMYKNAEYNREKLLESNEADGPLFKISNDPRITKVGRFIRKLSIDELPQLVNILKNDMSIIGPRPFVTYEQEQFNEYQSQRLYVKPGLSCYSSLQKNCHDDFNAWIENDLRYIKERSLKTDFNIVIRTIKLVLLHKNS